MRNGRAVRLGEPVECHALKARASDWDPIRGSHHGQRPKWLQQQAEYMTAPDIRGNVRFLLHRGRRPYMALNRRSLCGLLTCREFEAFRALIWRASAGGDTAAFDPSRRSCFATTRNEFGQPLLETALRKGERLCTSIATFANERPSAATMSNFG